jgi:BRO family, N-terminal domain
MSSTTPTVFTFISQTLRVVMRDGNPWFVAADVCAALGLDNNRQAVTRLDDDERGVISNDTPSGQQEMTIINESGLYSLILGSRKPEAKKFKKWVTSEVLPAIRKTGTYTAPTGPVDRYIDLTSHPDFRMAIGLLERKFWFSNSAGHNAWANMRKIGGCRATAFPESQLPRAREELKRITARTEEFFKVKCDFEEAAIKYVFGSGAEMIESPKLPVLANQGAIA